MSMSGDKLANSDDIQVRLRDSLRELGMTSN